MREVNLPVPASGIMKKFILFLFCIISGYTAEAQLKSGDIIFQRSLSPLSKAIQLATHSKYCHCGIIYKEGKDYFVYEAIGPVKMTPLDEWIARGADRHYVVKRLKNADSVLTSATWQKMKKAGEKFQNKHYDIYFEWSDDRIYCSELVYKIYKEATGLEVGQLQKLKDFDLTSKPVQEEMKERYGNKVPLNEPVISPVSILNSRLLITVK